MVVPRRHPRIVVRNDADFPHRCRGTSAQADADFPVWAGADLPCGFGLKMAETRRRTSCATAG